MHYWYNIKTKRYPFLKNNIKNKIFYEFYNYKFNYKNIALCYLMPLKCFRFEFIYLKWLKKYFKIRKYKRRTSRIHRVKNWINLSTNIYFKKKSKNSRMGKGVGLFEKKAFFICSGNRFIESSSWHDLSILGKNLSSKLNTKFLSIKRFNNIF